MLKNHLADTIRIKLAHTPTGCQLKLIEQLSEFVIAEDEKCIFLIKGYAGTGKTTVISALVKTLDEYGVKTVLLAPTGRAAKILGQYSGRPAYTIHKKIYRQLSSKDGFGKFMLEKNLHTNTLFIIDEASMIANQYGEQSIFGSGRLLDDLVEYVTQGRKCRIILIGDTAQLPPVGLLISPALDKNFLAAYFMDVNEVELNEVVRQEENSGILINATNLWNSITSGNLKQPKLRLHGYHDIKRIGGAELIDEMTSAYERYGINQTIVINRSNKRANSYNKGIRSQILGKEEEIVPGDLLMVVKNNYFWIKDKKTTEFIANGDIVEVEKIRKYYELYGFRFVDAKVNLADYDISFETRLILNTLNVESAALTSEQNKNLFYSIYEDYADFKPKKRGYEMVRNNPFFNALQVKFAYAVTCHKSQGGQWKAVFLDQGFIADDKIDLEYLRWLYTAMTRSTDRLYLVNFPDKYFE